MLELLNPQQITTIYHQRLEKDFPDNELKPLWMLLENKDELSYGYIEDGIIKGYCIILVKDHRCILDYLGVDPKLRNQGIGSKILSELRLLLPDHSIIIESEEPYDEISKRRIQFYLRNGWIMDPVQVNLYYVDYLILSNIPLSLEQILTIYSSFYTQEKLNTFFHIKECTFD